MYTRLARSFLFDCAVCPTPCDGNSKGIYLFDDDVRLSEHFEQRIIAHINKSAAFEASKTQKDGYPDIEIMNFRQGILSYLEVKVQQRTFMSVAQTLPRSGLLPSETVALNLSDLERYFSIAAETESRMSILWVLLQRPCITGHDEYRLFYQDITKLKGIYASAGKSRRFRRASGEGDVVGGKHKGVVVNYHFSLEELHRWEVTL